MVKRDTLAGNVRIKIKMNKDRDNNLDLEKKEENNVVDPPNKSNYGENETINDTHGSEKGN